MFDYRSIDNWFNIYNISDDEADRIAERANTREEFDAIWGNEDWWQDSAQPAMKFMTNQEIFDIVSVHLIKQGKQSIGPRPTDTTKRSKICLYRGPDGCQCAFGPLIPDDLYTPEMEGRGAEDVIRRWALPGLNSWQHGTLVNQLQGIHDGWNVSGWPERLFACARRFQLQTTALESALALAEA